MYAECEQLHSVIAGINKKNGCLMQGNRFLLSIEFGLSNDRDTLGHFAVGGRNTHHVDASLNIQVDVD